MNKQTKIALIGLVVLGLFFAGTVGLGFRKGNDKNGDPDETPPKWTEWLGKVLPSPIPSVALAKMQLNSKPLTKNKLTIGNTMAVITFLASDEKQRKVDAKWISGAPVKLTYKDNLPPDTQGKTPKDPTIGPNDRKNRIVVSKAGGRLTLTPLVKSITVVEFVGSE